MTGAKMADVKDCTGGLQNITAGVVPVDSGAPQPPARQHQPQGSPPPTALLKSPSATTPPGVRPVSHKGEGSAHNWPADSGNGLEDTGGDEFNTHPFDGITLADTGKENAGGLPGGLSQKDRDERLRILRDRQNEERQKKLEELKQQALAAQKFREQKEEERRRRIEHLRERDEGRRQQVEERKRQIWEAERDRREAILRKNQTVEKLVPTLRSKSACNRANTEREARIEAKRKNERSSIVFAFGSSTPRMLEPADTGGTFWGSRRATSTTNVMFSSMVGSTGGSSGGGDKTTSSGLGTSQGGVPTTSSTSLSRRSSERELVGGVMATSGAPTGSKKRAVSAHALDRKPGDEETDGPSRTSPFSSYGPSPRARKKTDLMPTIPSPRGSGGDGLHHKGRHKSPGVARSGDVTPSSPSRPLSALSVHSAAGSGVSFRHRPHLPLSPASHVTPLASPTSAPYTRKPRPVSIAITGVSHESAVSPVGSRDIRSSSKLSSDNRSRAQSAAEKEAGTKPPKVPSAKKSAPKSADTPTKKSTPSAMEKLQAVKSAAKTSPKASPIHSPGEPVQQDAVTEPVEDEEQKEIQEGSIKSSMERSTDGMEKQDEMKPVDGETEEGILNGEKEVVEEKDIETKTREEMAKKEKKNEEVKQLIEDITEEKEPDKGVQESSQDVDMTASMIARTRITTEEEAKAALAERRRLAREQAEREAELERLRLEEERRREEERQRLEEEEQRRAEAEQLRLLEEASRLEKERLMQAIEEAQKREREEALKKEEEAKARAEKEEQDKKAREEAERLRQEMEERLKKEEEERQMRRKRVEAIMLRTRAKAATPTLMPTKGGDEKEDSPSDERKEVREQQPSQMSEEEQKMVLESESGSHQEMTGGGSTSSSEPTTTEGSPSNQGTSPGHPVSTRNDTENTINSSANLLIGVNEMDPLQQAMLNNNGGEITRPVEQTNGHRNGMDFGPTSAFTNVDDVRLNNTANNLLDLSEFDTLGGVHLQQTQQLSGGGSNAFSYTKQLSHEDTVNSNAHAPPSSMGASLQPSIPSAPLQSVTGELDTIIHTGSPFQVEDSLSSAKRQDKNAAVGDLLS